MKVKIGKRMRPPKRIVFLSYVDDGRNGAKTCRDAFGRAFQPLVTDYHKVPLETRATDTAVQAGEVTESALAEVLRNVTDFLALLSSEYLTENGSGAVGTGKRGELSRVMRLKELETRADTNVLTIWFAPVELLNLELTRPGGCDPTKAPYSRWWHRLMKDNERFHVEPALAQKLSDQVFKAVKTVLTHPIECGVCNG